MLDRFCPRCGAERQEGARFCGVCGRSFEAEAPAPAPVIQQTVNTSPGVGHAVGQGFGWALGCLIFLLVALVVLAYSCQPH